MYVIDTIKDFTINSKGGLKYKVFKTIEIQISNYKTIYHPVQQSKIGDRLKKKKKKKYPIPDSYQSIGALPQFFFLSFWDIVAHCYCCLNTRERENKMRLYHNNKPIKLFLKIRGKFNRTIFTLKR